MNKIYGLKSDYAPVKREGTQIIVGYGYEAINKNEGTWYEVSLPAANYPLLSFADVKAAVEGDINADTTARITQGFAYTVKHGAQAGTEVNVWLSKENQSDFHAMHQNAGGLTFPVRYKIGELEGGTPVYEEFADADEMHTVCVLTSQHVLACQQEGWGRKDAIDWEPYKALFPQTEQANAETV
jgi:hypothetical protein